MYLSIPYAYKFSRDFIFANFANQRAFVEISTHTVQVAAAGHHSQIKIVKIVRCGAFAKYMYDPQKFVRMGYIFGVSWIEGFFMTLSVV